MKTIIKRGITPEFTPVVDFQITNDTGTSIYAQGSLFPMLITDDMFLAEGTTREKFNEEFDDRMRNLIGDIRTDAKKIIEA